MTAVNPPWVIQASSHPADVFRRMARFTSHGQQGVRDYANGDLAVAQNGSPNMSVNVPAGEAMVNGTQNLTSQGAYHCLNDATVNLTIAASDPTNPRIDIVVAQVQDATYSGATNAWSLAVVTGTPAPSPAPPATPNNAIVLAQVAVAANATSITSGNITDKRPVYGSLFHAEATMSGGQSIPNATVTVMAFDTIISDPNGNFTTGASAHYTCPVAGRYRVLSAVTWTTPGAVVNPLGISVYKNAVQARAGTQLDVVSGAVTPVVTVAAELATALSDLLDIRVTQSAGVSFTTSSGAALVYVSISFVGP